MRGWGVGERVVLAFKKIYILDLNLFDVIGFRFNLNILMGVLLNMKLIMP